MICRSPLVLAALPLFFTASAGVAQVSADDVWQDWQSYVASFGYAIEGQERRDGTQLIITGATVTAKGEDAGEMRFTMDRIEMTEQADGTVEIDLPAVIPMTFSGPSAQGGLARFSMDYRLNDMQMRASGTADTIDYSYAANGVSVTSTGIEMDGVLQDPEDNRIEIVAEDLSGTTQSIRGSSLKYAQSFELGSLRYEVLSADPRLQSQSNVTGQVQNLTFEGSTEMPAAAAKTAGDLNQLLAAGLRSEGTFRFGSQASTFLVTTPQGASDAVTTAESGQIGVRMEKGSLSYDGVFDTQLVEVNAAQSPLPLSLAIDRSQFNLTLPVQQSEALEDIALGLKLDGLTTSDALWGMFDPSGELPRDPAHVALDLSGQARLLFDLFDPASVEALRPDAAPVELGRVIVNQLRIAAMGAEVAGNGAFDFKTGALGEQKPEGAMNFTLTGVNALIDRLISARLLPEDQAMGIRMMMALLSAPGQTPDTLTSRIEINDQGHVIANGQRIQ